MQHFIFRQTPSIMNSEIIIYQSEDGKTRIEVRLEGETVWLTLNQLAELFQRDNSVISRHIKAIYEEGELPIEGTVAKNATLQNEGDREVLRQIEYYNLDMIISVGYRVNSHRGTQFRIWVKERIIRRGGKINPASHQTISNTPRIQRSDCAGILFFPVKYPVPQRHRSGDWPSSGLRPTGKQLAGHSSPGDYTRPSANAAPVPPACPFLGCGWPPYRI